MPFNSDSSVVQALLGAKAVLVRQRKELAELFGFETRNKYAIETEEGLSIGFAAEQQKGVFGFIWRQMLGHWRSFEVTIFGNDRKPEYTVTHPFRFYFEKLSVTDVSGRAIGSMERRFSIFTKKFDLFDAHGQLVLEMRSPLWRIWTFPFTKDGNRRAVVEKKWGGVIREAFTDADLFRLEFSDSTLRADERLILLAAAIFVDLRYFETKPQRQNVVDHSPI